MTGSIVCGVRRKDGVVSWGGKGRGKNEKEGRGTASRPSAVSVGEKGSGQCWGN